MSEVVIHIFNCTRCHLENRIITTPATCGEFSTATDRTFEFAAHLVSHICVQNSCCLSLRKSQISERSRAFAFYGGELSEELFRRAELSVKKVCKLCKVVPADVLFEKSKYT